MPFWFPGLDVNDIMMMDLMGWPYARFECLLLYCVIPMYEPSGAMDRTRCIPHNSSVFTLGEATPALDGANTWRQRHQIK